MCHCRIVLSHKPCNRAAVAVKADADILEVLLDVTFCRGME